MMLKKFFQFIGSNIPVVVLICISLVVCYVNYTPNTFLTGWDTLHPEFNFSEYWWRIIDGVWQEHQGLGAVASQAHASEIPRIIILELLSLVFKLNQLRYSYAFLMLVLGPIGVYYFIQQLALRRCTGWARNLGGFAGGLIYLLNLGTMQQFYVPLEMFLTHYGLLGWNLLFLAKFFETGKRKHLFLYLLVAFFILSQAHTATLFYAYFLGLNVFLFILGLVSWSTKELGFKTVAQRYAQLIFLTLMLNSFWFLPNVYFTLVHGKEVSDAKITFLFSEEAFLANKRYGDIKDIAIIKGYLFSWGEHVGNGHFGDLLNEWELHLKDKNVLIFGYAFFFMSLFGLIIAFWRREKYAYPVACVLFMAMFFLMSDNPPFGFVFVFLQNSVPMFKEALRFPFTKFSVLYMFSFSVFFGYFYGFFGELLAKLLKKEGYILLTHFIVYVFVVITLCDFMSPVFRGYMISPSMRVNIPDRYFEMFKYFNSQNDYGRVAHFPVHSFWGWVYYNWDSSTKLGYQGAGFLWFGIKQPLLDREFDRWNLLNEQYYNEVAYAVYSQDPVMLKNVFDKYKVRWVLLDESEQVIDDNPKQLFYPEIEALLSKTQGFVLEKDFGNGLKVYKDLSATYANEETSNTYYEAGNSYYKENLDPIYSLYKPYVATNNVVFPFIGLTNTDGSLNNAYVSSTDTAITLKSHEATPVQGTTTADSGVLSVYATKTDSGVDISIESKYKPGNVVKTYSVPVTPDTQKGIIVELENQRMFVDVTALTDKAYVDDVYVPLNIDIAVNIYLPTETLPVTASSNLEACSDTGKGAAYSIETSDNGLTLTGRNVKACATLKLNEIVPDVTNEVLRISYQPSDNASDICVLDDSLGLCVNQFLADKTSLVKINNNVNLLNLRFYSNASGFLIDKSVSYNNIQIEKYALNSSDTLNLDKSFGEVSLPSEVTLNKTIVYDPSKLMAEADPYNCATGSFDFEVSSVQRDITGITYTAKKQSVCDSYPFPTLSHSLGYILEVKTKNIVGVPLRFCLTNELYKKCDVYVSVPQSHEMKSYFYFVPTSGAGMGYTLNLSNLTFGNDPGENELGYIAISPVDDKLLKSTHVNVLVSSNSTLLMYNQAYEKGWTALCGFGICSAEHVKVDNWTNGWIFKSPIDLSTVKIVFLPQALEYFGFILVPLAVVFGLIFTKFKNKPKH